MEFGARKRLNEWLRKSGGEGGKSEKQGGFSCLSIEDILDVKSRREGGETAGNFLLVHKCLFLVGGFGVGKTTMVKDTCQKAEMEIQHIDCCLYTCFADIRKLYLEAVSSQSVRSNQIQANHSPGIFSYFKPNENKVEKSDKNGNHNGKSEADVAKGVIGREIGNKRVYHITGFDFFLNEGIEKLMKNLIEFVDRSEFPFIVEVNLESWGIISKEAKNIISEVDNLFVDVLNEERGKIFVHDLIFRTFKHLEDVKQGGAGFLDPEAEKKLWKCFRGNLAKLSMQVEAIAKYIKPKSASEAIKNLEKLIHQETMVHITSQLSTNFSQKDITRIVRSYPSVFRKLELSKYDTRSDSTQDDKPYLSKRLDSGLQACASDIIEYERLVEKYSRLDQVSSKFTGVIPKYFRSPEGSSLIFDMLRLESFDNISQVGMKRSLRSSCKSSHVMIYRPILSKLMGDCEDEERGGICKEGLVEYMNLMVGEASNQDNDRGKPEKRKKSTG